MRVLLVGLGQLGSRYLEGICFADIERIEVDVVEPIDSAYEVGLALATAQTERGNVSIKRVGMSGISGRYRLCILATTAKERPDATVSISTSARIDFWVFEKILAQDNLSLDLIRAAASKSEGAWVNTPRRITSLYGLVDKFLDDSRVIDFCVFRKDMGIGCNAVHFLDAVQWLSRSKLVEVSLDNLKPWVPAKRPGNYDFEGCVRCSYDNGSTLFIDSRGSRADEITCSNRAGELLKIDESRGILRDGKLFAARVEYQSELTPNLIECFLAERPEPKLPTLAESVKQHALLLSAIKSNELLAEKCEHGVPIT